MAATIARPLTSAAEENLLCYPGDGYAGESIRWADTYAAVNELEYWAEGVQSYFDANGSAERPDGIHNHVDTRSELETYDPDLYALVDEVFGGVASPDACP